MLQNQRRGKCARFRMATMNKVRRFAAVFAMISAVLLTTATIAEAQKRDDRDIRDAMRSLNSKLDDFEMNLRYQMQSGSANTSHLDDVSDRIRATRDAMRRFQDNFDRKRENRNDVNDIISAAKRVEEFMQTYPQNRVVEDNWKASRSQIDRLSANYGITTIWDSGEEPPQNVKDYPDDNRSAVTGKTFSIGLSGTYTLDTARSENVDEIVAETNVAGDQRGDLKDKLTSPEQIALDIRGNQVTLAATNAPPVTINADGRDKVEKDSAGRSVKLRATLTGDTLVVSSLGGETDYTITFTSVSDGRGMKVSRRITTDYLKETVFAESVYNKTDATAQLGIKSGSPAVNTTDPNGAYSDNDNSPRVTNGGGNSSGGSTTGNTRTGAPTAVTTKPGNYVVPNGVVLMGNLENEINTKASQNNDRFRLTVQSPNEFRGAVIEGYVSNVQRSGKVTGQSNITFNFERITLKNGQTYDFAGNLQEIRDSTGKSVVIDNEGSVKGKSQTTTTAVRTGIGAGIGAIIGAIAGGGKGAAIGAAIGGGAGAGSTIITGQDDLRLMQGSTISVTSSSPMNIGTK